MSTDAAAPMQALAIAMVKNEADIIEASIRHNLHFVDLIAVIDNGSTDGTREILEALRREGVPLLIFDDPVFGHFQSEKVTHVYRKVAPIFNPELVYLLDADEFIRAPSRAALEAALAGLAPGSQALLPWTTHLPDTAVDAARMLRDPLGTTVLRRRVEEPLYFKAVIRRAPQHDTHLVIEQGNHAARLEDGTPLPSVRLNGVALAHLPVRSVEQVASKAVNGWHACMVRNLHRNVPGEAFQWKAIYERIARGPGLDAATLVEVALGYAQSARPGRNLADDAVADPTLARYGTLSHLALGRHSARAKVALSVEGFLREAAPRPAPTGGAPKDLVSLDLAPLADLATRLELRGVVTTEAGAALGDALRVLCPLADRTPGQAAELLLAPAFADEDLAPLVAAVSAEGAGLRRIVCWTASTSSPEPLRNQLAAWQAAGWEPQLMETMAARALASFAALRHGLLVLGPADPAQAARVSMVRELLCAIAGAPHAWADPLPQRVEHPLQSLQLGREAAVAHV